MKYLVIDHIHIGARYFGINYDGFIFIVSKPKWLGRCALNQECHPPDTTRSVNLVFGISPWTRTSGNLFTTRKTELKDTEPDWITDLFSDNCNWESFPSNSTHSTTQQYIQLFVVSETNSMGFRMDSMCCLWMLLLWSVRSLTFGLHGLVVYDNNLSFEY